MKECSTSQAMTQLQRLYTRRLLYPAFGGSICAYTPIVTHDRVRVYNADATENKKGLISHYIRCQVQIGNHTSWQSFLVADIGRQDLIIGMSFLREHNPEIDWKNGQLEFSRCPTGCKPPTTPVHKEELEGILPHLEDVARDEFGDLEPGSWETQEQLLHWVSHSEDPSARILRAKTKDLHNTPGVKDKDY